MWKYIDVALWILVAASLTMAVVMALSFRDLKREVTAARQEVAAAQLEVTRLRREAALLQTNKAISETTVTDVQAQLKQLGFMAIAPSKACAAIGRLNVKLGELSSAQRQLLPIDVFNITSNSCDDVRTATDTSRNDATVAFIDVYLDAVSARLQPDPAKARRLYDAALRAPGIGLVHAQWRIRALEGRAYAAMELGDYPAARADLAALEALRVTQPDYVFVFQGLTGLKTMCRSGASPAEVRAALARLRAEMDQNLASQTDPARRRWATIDRGYVEADGELFQLCAAAGVKPIALGG